MDINSAFPSNYISSEDLQGQDVPVQIHDCRMEPVKQDNGPDKDKPVVYFTGHGRGLVLNVTNGLAIASLHGNETDGWRGQWITLYPTQCQFGAKMVDCIRVRPFAPGHAPGQPHANGLQTTGQQQPPPFVPPAAGQQTFHEQQPAQQPQTAGQSPVQF